MSRSPLDKSNQLLSDAAAARPARGPNAATDRFLYPLLSIVAVILIALFAGVPFLVLSALLLGRPAGIPGPDQNLDLFLLLVVNFGPIFLALALWLSLVEKRGVRSLGFPRRAALLRFGRGMGVGILLMVLAIGVPLLAGVYRPVNTLAPFPTLLSIVALLVAWSVQGSAEEALTRGFLLPVIGVRWGLAAGVGISSLLFSLLHLLNPNIGAVPVVNLFLFGLFTAFYALAEESLWGVCAVHAVWNWALGNLFGFPVSGQDLGGSTALALTDGGPAWLTGGSFGPEGGLMVTAVLVMATAVAALVWWRQLG